MVGTIPLRSILWMAAADTPARSASCCSDSPRCRRSSRRRGPMAPTIRSTRRWPGDVLPRVRRDGLAEIRQPADSLTAWETYVQYSKRLRPYPSMSRGGGDLAQRIVVVGGGAAGIGAAGAAKATDRERRGHRLHRVRGRRLQPVRHPLRPRQGDPRLRAPLPGHQGGVQGGRDRHPLRDQGHRPRRRAARPSRSTGEGDRGRLGPPHPRHRLRLRRPRHARHRPGRALLREEHPPGHGVGQGPRHDQGGGGGGGVAPRPGDGHRPRPPGHRDPPGRPGAVGPGRGGRPRHRRAGRGVVGRDGREDALEHARPGVRRRRQRPGQGGAHRRRRPARRPGGGLHQEEAQRQPVGQRRSRSAPPAGSSSTSAWPRRTPTSTPPATAPSCPTA